MPESEKLWKAATELGFWYVITSLKNHGANSEVDGMFDMGAETMKLSMAEKLKFDQGDGGQSFGYKAIGVYATNEYGDPDNVEFINISREDALAYPEIIHRTYPSTVNSRMGPTITPFVRKSLAIIDTVFSVTEERLDLPMACCIKSPPIHVNRDSAIEKDMVALGAHTDFGSLSFLHNRLGGLQVLPPGSSDWQYVLPIPGHAICNIGDALTIFSGGILRSNLHRIVPPPGAQRTYTRWSVVFFSRPSHNVPLRALEESDTIKAAIARMSLEDQAKHRPGMTQGDWYARRVSKERIKNMKSPKTWTCFERKGVQARRNLTLCRRVHQLPGHGQIAEHRHLF
ncbi:hypothetical protein ACEPAF_8441 [Sanghuangporus sanghuang]